MFRIIETVVHIFEPYAPVSDELQALTDQYVSVLDGRRVLIILDGLRSGEFLDILARPTSCGLLIAANERSENLSGESLTLGRLSQQASEELVVRICPRAGAHAAGLATICQNVPLSLCLMAGYLKCNSAIEIDDFVNDFGQSLKRAAGQPGRRGEELLAFLLDRLTAGERDLFLRLSVFSSGFDAALAAAVHSSAPPEDVGLEGIRAHLNHFAGLNLLTYD
ncbi:MAG TPA: hypothetical protein VLZ89_01380, partial [Anaerolineales bacterium]|nr:hypothetical protein [Anaerolineales bacterium]